MIARRVLVVLALVLAALGACTRVVVLTRGSDAGSDGVHGVSDGGTSNDGIGSDGIAGTDGGGGPGDALLGD